jgi:hypothetical protein
MNSVLTSEVLENTQHKHTHATSENVQPLHGRRPTDTGLVGHALFSDNAVDHCGILCSRTHPWWY